jgi:seryl-tRNA synthetase
VDEYFGKIKGMNGTDEKAIHALKYEQMQQSSHGKDEMHKERGQLQDRIKRLQAEANQIENNLSFFGNSGKSNPMLAEYQQKIDKGNAEIKKLKEQLKLIPVSN